MYNALHASQLRARNVSIQVAGVLEAINPGVRN